MAASEKIVSYGTSSYGYDVRCSPEFKVFTNINSAFGGPEVGSTRTSFVDVEERRLRDTPQFLRACAVRWSTSAFRATVLTICLGKSTYARCGIIVNVTPLEPEWEGHVTLEFSNTTTHCPPRFTPMRVWPRCCFSSPTRSARQVVQGPGRQVPGPAGRNPAQGLIAAPSGSRAPGFRGQRWLRPRNIPFPHGSLPLVAALYFGKETIRGSCSFTSACGPNTAGVEVLARRRFADFWLGNAKAVGLRFTSADP